MDAEDFKLVRHDDGSFTLYLLDAENKEVGKFYLTQQEALELGQQMLEQVHKITGEQPS